MFQVGALGAVACLFHQAAAASATSGAHAAASFAAGAATLAVGAVSSQSAVVTPLPPLPHPPPRITLICLRPRQKSAPCLACKHDMT